MEALTKYGIIAILVLLGIYISVKLIQWKPKDVSEPSEPIVSPAFAPTTYKEAIRLTYHEGLSLLLKTPACHDPYFELIAFLDAVGEIALIEAGIPLFEFSGDLMDFTRDINLSDEDRHKLFRRSSFYQEKSDFGKLRGEWTIKEIGGPLLESPFFRALIAFGDILVNPNCADDYDNCPVAQKDLHQLSEFSLMFTNQFTFIIQRYIRALTNGKVRF